MKGKNDLPGPQAQGQTAMTAEQLVCSECGTVLGGWMIDASPHGVVILCDGCKEAADEAEAE